MMEENKIKNKNLQKNLQVLKLITQMSQIRIKYPSTTNVQEENVNGFTYLTLTGRNPGDIEIVTQAQLSEEILPPVSAVRTVPGTTVSTTTTSRVVNPALTPRSPLPMSMRPAPLIVSPPRTVALPPAVPRMNPGAPTFYSSVASPTGAPIVEYPTASPVNIPRVYDPSVPMTPFVSPVSPPMMYGSPMIDVFGNILEPGYPIPTYGNFQKSCIGQENTLIIKTKKFIDPNIIVPQVEQYADVKCTEVKAGHNGELIVLHFANHEEVKTAHEALKRLYRNDNNVEVYQ
jgi:hypothetical protein